MWIQQRVSLQYLLFCGLCCLSIILCQEENDVVGNGGIKRKNKRVQEVKFKNNLYDQVMQESDHDSSSNNGHLSTPYGMRIATSSNKARNPRAEPSYQRNYHYSSRDSPSGNWGGGGGGGGDGRQLSSFSLGGLQGAASSAPADYAFGDVDDNSVAAGGHGHQQSHGWGWQGHSGGHQQSHGKDCNSALGLLGVLGLASYLQNVLRQMSTTAATVGRRKRRNTETDTDEDYHQTESRDDITPTLLPLLMSISHAKDGNVPMKCALRPYCVANSFLTKRLGDMSEPVCEQLQSVMESSVENSSNLGLKPKWRKISALRELRLAARSGVKGKDCFKLYPHCHQLERLITQTNSTSSKSSLPLGFSLAF